MTPRRAAPPHGADIQESAAELESSDSAPGSTPSVRRTSGRPSTPLPATRHGLWELPAGDGVPVLR